MQTLLIKNSFYFTYIFLITTGTICFIEALRNPEPKIRHIMNLETCISVVAGYFYGLFVEKIKNYEKTYNENSNNNNINSNDNSNSNDETILIDGSNNVNNVNNVNNIKYDNQFLLTINNNRYVDWSISTPLMLLVLCLVLGLENKITVNFWTFLLILLFNYLMLGAGFLGEKNKLPRTLANIIGFVFFFALYGLLYYVYMRKNKTFNSLIIYLLFVVLWAFYGVFYQMSTLTKIFGYNILDLLSKAFVGIFFWLYLTKSVKF